MLNYNGKDKGFITKASLHINDQNYPLKDVEVMVRGYESGLPGDDQIAWVANLPIGMTLGPVEGHKRRSRGYISFLLVSDDGAESYYQLHRCLIDSMRGCRLEGMGENLSCIAHYPLATKEY